MMRDVGAEKALNAANVANTSVLEPLMPLVIAGYESLAARAIRGIEAWYSTLSPESRTHVSGKLASLNLVDTEPASKLYGQSPTSGHTLYVVTGNGEQRRTIASGLLEKVIYTATKELSALVVTGNVAGINLSTLNNLFLSLNYGTFNPQTPTVAQSVQIAVSTAISYYTANGGQEFVQQLYALSKLNQILIVSPPVNVSKQLDYTPDGRLLCIAFRMDNKTPALLNIIFGLRLLYLAASSVLALPSRDGAELREKLSEVAAAHGLSPGITESHVAEDLTLDTIATQLERVSLHKGIEMLIADTPDMPTKWRTLFLLANVLDTIRTGKAALNDSDKPYSDAIGLAELVG